MGQTVTFERLSDDVIEASVLVSTLVEAAVMPVPGEPTRVWPHQEVEASAA